MPWSEGSSGSRPHGWPDGRVRIRRSVGDCCGPGVPWGEGLLVAGEVVDPMVRQDSGQGSVPPIEDEVEKNHHGGVLTDVSYFTGFMVGLMSAATPPTLPAKDEA